MLKGQYSKEINELKMKLQKLEHENIVIKQDVRIMKNVHVEYGREYFLMFILYV